MYSTEGGEPLLFTHLDRPAGHPSTSGSYRRPAVAGAADKQLLYNPNIRDTSKQANGCHPHGRSYGPGWLSSQLAHLVSLSSAANSCCYSLLPGRTIRRRHNLLLPFFHSPTQHSMGQAAASGQAAAGPVLTFRALAAGLLVGAVLCFSNTYFGLQTGWVTMGSLQSAILGYGLFQGLGAAGLLSGHLSVAENVIVQTTAVATATMPLAAGLVGIIPALGLLSVEEHPPTGPVTLSPWQLLGWCSALAFFGVFVAVPLRYQTIIREKLRFPSGTATASVIRTLHGLPPQEQEAEHSNSSSAWRPQQQQRQQSSQQQIISDNATAAPQEHEQEQQQGSGGQLLQYGSGGPSQVDLEVAVLEELEAERSRLLTHQLSSGYRTATSSNGKQQQQWARALRLLLWCFGVSGAYSLAAAWVKPLRVLPVFDWLHLPAATAWGWALQPSAGYIGQGMIMGPKTAWSMMAGAITGWAVLGPMAKARGWAPGEIKDVDKGAAGWLMWLGLALLLGDCFSELALLIANTTFEQLALRGCLQHSIGARGHPRTSAAVDSQRVARAAGSYQQLANADADADQLGQSSVNSSEQQLHGLRSRSGSRSAAAGCSLELSPSTSVLDVMLPAADGQQQEGAGLQPDNSNHSSCNSLSDGGLSQRPSSPALAAASGSLNEEADDSALDAHGWLLSWSFWVPGLVLSTVLATAILAPMLGMPFYEPLVAVVVALLVALLAVRALGQTDLNPVSGVGKVSQLVFAVVSPGAVLPNLVAGAIAEAGAQQAGDLMQDFKTAYLLGVPPSSQLLAMLLGSAASVPLSVAAYLLYTTAWQVPGPVLPAPTAQIWLDMAKLVNGGHLPDHIGPFCAAAAAIAAILPVLQLVLRRFQSTRAATHSSRPPISQQQRQQLGKIRGRRLLQQAGMRLLQTWQSRSAVDWVLALMPSGVGFAVGMYLTPNWTLPRLLGSVVEQTWLLFSPQSHTAFMMVTASGLVLGEGCASVVQALIKALLA